MMQIDVEEALLALLTISLSAWVFTLVLFAIGTRRTLRTNDPRRLARGDVSTLPAVTILKPCAGADDDLEACLESYCAIDYPCFQIVFGVRNECDLAYPVIERVRARHPGLDITVVFSGDAHLPSPKISNVERMDVHGKHPVLWLTDSNTRVHPDTLYEMMTRLAKPGVSAVCSPVVGDGERATGSVFDTLELNALVNVLTYSIRVLTGMTAAPGKSVVFTRATLERLGGWPEVGKYFGEDIIVFERIRSWGEKVDLAGIFVTNVSTAATFSKFFSRHVRWAQIRWRVVTIPTALEPLLYLAVPSFALFAYRPSWQHFALFVTLWCAQVVSDLWVMRHLRRHPMPLAALPHVFARPVVHVWLVVKALFTFRVEWRGNYYFMGPSSMCLTEAPYRTRLRALRDAVMSREA